MTLTSRVAVEAFVFTWKGHDGNAAALEQAIAPLAPVTVINSDPGVAGGHPHWVNLDDSAYFTAQWNEAIRRFDGEVLFHMQADASSNQLPELIDKATSLFASVPLGVYEPAVDYTAQQYDTARLRPIWPGVFEVPWTDCTCWFIAREVVDALPRVDASINRYGWGIPRAMSAAAKARRLLCVRDYTMNVAHPRGRGYSSREALTQMYTYLASLPPELTRELKQLQALDEVARILPR